MDYFIVVFMNTAEVSLLLRHSKLAFVGNSNSALLYRLGGRHFETL